ncbi:PaaX family transcriptional regulator C-terminal domain-containing protein [Nocardioides sp. B-3]|uniref:PaaX family transcriptional regulator C-terminal domain-containing protein n=1 Tax=Nocardioides sp. B-3 TaxID=2895565 RepID=UPI0021525964|nr:PaaX family transcriptional regulator C-terminal domain-containing protein [Nocardioides sp. B-3]UUZ61482.1 PaaX domain-containing protein, C- domain protein [Nocardioides sp. B-3]
MPSTAADTSLVRPVSARSALPGLLLGAEEPALSARELVAGARLVGFAEPTVRVALSRMLAAEDLVRTDDGGYRLSPRLLHRQRLQEAAIHVRTKEWDGAWDMVVVTATGRSAADRARLRSMLQELRLAELREGVWVRPANLDLAWPDDLADLCERLTMQPAGDPAELAARLWDLSGWAERARALLAATDTDDPVLRFTACATSVRHLLEDPALPDELLPRDWPGAELRRAHLDYRTRLTETRRANT